jgi:hypothetical protein
MTARDVPALISLVWTAAFWMKLPLVSAACGHRMGKRWNQPCKQHLEGCMQVKRTICFTTDGPYDSPPLHAHTTIDHSIICVSILKLFPALRTATQIWLSLIAILIQARPYLPVSIHSRPQILKGTWPKENDSQPVAHYTMLLVRAGGTEDRFRRPCQTQATRGYRLCFRRYALSANGCFRQELASATRRRG